MPVKPENAGDELDELFDYQPNLSSESDLSEDDTTYKSPASGSRSKIKKASTRILDLGTILKAPRATQYSTRTIYTMVKDDIVDLEPEYQRGVVWTVDKQSAVIESIMRHYYVPPVLLSVQNQVSTEDELTYVCIDGKQRISSICAFLDNKIPVREPSTSRRFWYKEDLIAGKTPALNAAQRRKFDNEQLTVVEFEGLSDEVERDMFSRVQMGVTLSPAEKLGAHLGPWPDFIRQMVKRFIDPTPSLVHDDEGKSMLIVNRGRDYLFTAQMALLIMNHKIENFVPSASAIDTFLKQHAKDEPSRPLRLTLQRTLERYVALANHPRYGKCIKPETKLNRTGRAMSKPLSPAEFVYIAFLIFKFPNASVSQLYELVQGLKADVRSQFKDVLMNTNIASVMRRYIGTATLTPDAEGSSGQNGTSQHKRNRAALAVGSDENDDLPLSARRRTSNGLDVNPDAGLFRSVGDSPNRNPLTNFSSAPARR
ncbi:hypothetical protein NDA11_000733 [Ustilago hordei]|uniref:GmrSD restriction endonucleases N-terminal domain-containing protein n=1 Tax=Ustilago hordei TaxID=120017 RepID=I2FR62_USTHO|nr:uncharacterized protein UHO2_05547 [Ustilago hordei]KAJ1042672.1 hypothetical protein NDA10_004739 [Ustilago hordei]KAJ1572674.1 hypothetical protein NDA15_000347 [Ustilago hordei]KAJ1575130.1 hypothetical protein NDA11_000733 [Ustilago hordei]KAJ1575736.1 hypothetical protein NDA12_003943 [Ustilago hordei]KAJ1598139.1 hypothetical protein NDA14_005839 [Ustilago hordei]